MSPAPPTTTRLAHGDAHAFAEFYDQHARALLALARSLTGSEADAEDAVQQTFVDLFRSRASFAAANSPRAYALCALHRTAVRLRERNGRMQALSEHGEPLARGERAGGGDDRLEHALQSLSAQQREVVALKLDGELTFEEIGAALGLSPDTVASRYRRALEKLRERLGGAR